MFLLPLTNISQQLGEKPIGKGGFGAVFKGLDLETGDVVAIKQMQLGHHLPKEELASLMVSSRFFSYKTYQQPLERN